MDSNMTPGYIQEEMQYKGYREYKKELDAELNRAAESFVKIGYLLRLAEDTDILKESPYRNVHEFAKAEYNLDASQVSRFININKKYSEGGYADRLQESFRGYGYAKLAIMMMLPDAVVEEITPSYSKAEINAIKAEIDKERQITDIEVILEGTDESLPENELAAVLCQIREDVPELAAELAGTAKKEGWSIDMVKRIMAPAGEKMYSVRIRGVGRKLLSLKDFEDKVSLTAVRSGEKSIYGWEDILEIWKSLIDISVEKIAPVQSEKRENQKQVRKESKVLVVEKREKEIEPEKPDVVEAEQLPGQTSIEKGFPEYMPDETECAETVEDVEEEEAKPPISSEEVRKRRAEYGELLEEEIEHLKKCVEVRHYESARYALKEISLFLDRLEELAEEEEDEE